MGNPPTKPKGTSLRAKAVRVKTARGRKTSSTLWLHRQLNDPYVQRAKQEGYRSRAAYKLIEMDDRLKFLKPGSRIVDLGAAPGGWTQVAVARTHSGKHKSACVIGLDILPIDPINGATLLTMDFMDDSAPAAIAEHLGGQADIVLSDMAPNTMGHTATDHLRIMALVELAHEFAREILAPGGSFIAKVWQGGTEQSMLASIKKEFAQVRHIKPKASRADSSEMYLVATGFKGRRDA